nr:hypothetical protein B0A51_02642 [Rachicladosporium sp. CCFEE 5018]
MPSRQNGAGAHGSEPRNTSYPPGIHVPSLTFFGDDQRQEIDWTTQERHFSFLAKSGVHGIVLAGTNGEAITLTRSEKAELVRSARKVATDHGKSTLPITLGTSGTSTRDVIDDCIVAGEAGADFVLVLVPSFFHFAMSKDAICEFFEEVAAASPLPVLIYNFPGVAAGLNVDSTMLDRLTKHENIIGLTCGGIAKVTRLSAAYPTTQFCAIAGQSDWLVPAMSVGGTGCITGVANLYPRACVKVYDLYMAEDLAAAQKLQYTLAVSELGFSDGGINGTKWVVGELLGYSERSRDCRRPYPKFEDQGKRQWILEQVRALEADEAKLQKVS